MLTCFHVNGKATLSLRSIPSDGASWILSRSRRVPGQIFRQCCIVISCPVQGFTEYFSETIDSGSEASVVKRKVDEIGVSGIQLVVEVLCIVRAGSWYEAINNILGHKLSCIAAFPNSIVQACRWSWRPRHVACLLMLARLMAESGGEE